MFSEVRKYTRIIIPAAWSRQSTRYRFRRVRRGSGRGFGRNPRAATSGRAADGLRSAPLRLGPSSARRGRVLRPFRARTRDPGPIAPRTPRSPTAVVRGAGPEPGTVRPQTETRPNPARPWRTVAVGPTLRACRSTAVPQMTRSQTFSSRRRRSMRAHETNRPSAPTLSKPSRPNSPTVVKVNNVFLVFLVFLLFKVYEFFSLYFL